MGTENIQLRTQLLQKRDRGSTPPIPENYRDPKKLTPLCFPWLCSLHKLVPPDSLGGADILSLPRVLIKRVPPCRQSWIRWGMFFLTRSMQSTCEFAHAHSSQSSNSVNLVHLTSQNSRNTFVVKFDTFRHWRKTLHNCVQQDATQTPCVTGHKMRQEMCHLKSLIKTESSVVISRIPAEGDTGIQPGAGTEPETGLRDHTVHNGARTRRPTQPLQDTNLQSLRSVLRSTTNEHKTCFVFSFGFHKLTSFVLWVSNLS